MADMLEVSQKTYSNIENAGNNITIELIEKISKILNVNFNKILELNAEAILNNHQQSGGINQLNNAPSYNYLDEKKHELFEKLLLEKDLRLKQYDELLKVKDDLITALKQ